MINMLLNLALSRLCFVMVVILIFSAWGSYGKRGGYLNFQFVCYQNPGHLDYEGHKCDSIPRINCDPYFIICISNRPINEESPANCPVYYLKTDPFYDKESVCNYPSDNRGVLQKIPELELVYPLQEAYFVRVVVMDYNQFTAHRYIGVFSTTFNGVPSPNYQNFVNSEIFMTRYEVKVQNPHASLKISMGLKCDWNLYGHLCYTFCKALPTDNFICSNKGKKTCKSGWIGKYCFEKDLCKTLQCANGGYCIIIEGIPKCICNGIIGPQCYLNFKPCSPNPCKNGGVCSRDNFHNNEIHCNCTGPYYGSHCHLMFNVCLIDPCRNNGTCDIIKNGSRICKCLPMFKGILCDQRIITTVTHSLIHYNITAMSILEENKNKFGIIFGILFATSLIIILAVGGYFLIIRRKNRNNYNTNEKSIRMNYITSNNIPSMISNNYVQVKEEGIYDTIEERETYVYQKESNDDYLVPSRPRTPVQTPSNISETSDYAPMCSNDNSITENEITVINTIENEYLPPLPTRSASKKHFQMFTKFKF